MPKHGRSRGGGRFLKADTQKKALELTQQIMERWYRLDTALLKENLDENASWIGAAEGQFFLGRPAVLDALENVCTQLMPCSVSGQTYRITDSGPDWCLVAGLITVTLESKEMVLREPQRLTFLWKMRNRKLFLSHIHVSNNAAVVAPDEEFPIKASRSAYEFLEEHISGGAVTVMASDRSIYRIERGTVLYLSADNEYMIIHGQNGDIRLHRKLSDVMTEQFPKFLKLHRSYYVNPCYLRVIRAFEAELTDGTRLPIARERYAVLCKELGVTN